MHMSQLKVKNNFEVIVTMYVLMVSFAISVLNGIVKYLVYYIELIKSLKAFTVF